MDTKKVLIDIVGDGNVRDDITDLYAYGVDASVQQNLPNFAVRPEKIEHVQKIVKYANEELIPIVPRGAQGVWVQSL